MQNFKKNEEIKRKICIECGLEKNENQFYYSREKDKKLMDVCKNCFKNEFIEGENNFNIFKKYNIPFFQGLWDACDDLGKYLSKINSLPQYRDLQWKDSILEENKTNDKYESSFYNSIVKNLKNEANKLNERLTKIRENNNDMNSYISTLKSLRETLDLISKYDWQLMYSQYSSLENGEAVLQISIWEQNHDNQIKNHKIWTIKDDESSLTKDNYSDGRPVK